MVLTNCCLLTKPVAVHGDDRDTPRDERSGDHDAETGRTSKYVAATTMFPLGKERLVCLVILFSYINQPYRLIR